jgi:hypothetical protein
MAAEEGGFIKTTMLSAAVFFKPRRDENFREGSRGGEGRLNKGGRLLRLRLRLRVHSLWGGCRFRYRFARINVPFFGCLIFGFSPIFQRHSRDYFFYLLGTSLAFSAASTRHNSDVSFSLSPLLCAFLLVANWCGESLLLALVAKYAVGSSNLKPIQRPSNGNPWAFTSLHDRRHAPMNRLPAHDVDFLWTATTHTSPVPFLFLCLCLLGVLCISTLSNLSHPRTLIRPQPGTY